MPAWFALIVQSPRPMNETVEPETVQTPALLGSAVKVTASPELETAVTVYGESFLSFFGAVDVNVIVCAAFATVKDCCFCGAAW